MCQCATSKVPIEITIDAFRTSYNDGDLLIDCRTEQEYEQGHLKDAVLLPMQHLSVRFQTLVQHLDEPVYIYCNSGNRSATFARYLRTLGHTNSQSISGGYEAWGDPC